MKKLIFLALFLINLAYGEELGSNTIYKYTAVSDHGILVSNDVATWEYIDLANQIKPVQSGYQVSFKSIAYGNNKFVIVGSYGLVASSTDEVHWTTNYIPQFTGTWLNSVVFYHGKFYANSNSTIYSSVDGITWINQGSPNYITKLAIANDSLFAIGSSKLLRLGGFGWTTVYEDKTNVIDFRTISYGNNTYVVNSTNGTSTLTSIDGINWIKHTAAMGYGPEGQSSIYIDKFIVIKYLDPSQDCHYGSISNDGLNWTFNTMTVNNNQGSYGWVYFIAYDNSIFIAGGGSNSPTILLSNDAIHWYSATLPASHGSGFSLDIAIVK